MKLTKDDIEGVNMYTVLRDGDRVMAGTEYFKAIRLSKVREVVKELKKQLWDGINCQYANEQKDTQVIVDDLLGEVLE